jgi:hypothetical protein
MPRTSQELAQAAADADAWLDSLDPAATPFEDTADLYRIGAALAVVADGSRELDEAVQSAHANGRTWGEIALVLGVSRQAARQRYGTHTRAS